MSKTVVTTYYGREPGERMVKHSYTDQWEQVDVDCPHCRGEQVWREVGEGDYYEGQKHMCTGCGSWFYYKGYELINKDPYDTNYQTLQQLRGKDV